MVPSWEQINEFEIAEDYPAAIDTLESRLKADPNDKEAVNRLGFNYWLAIAEGQRLSLNVAVSQYAERFLELLNNYESTLGGDPDFCWAYGLPLSMNYYDFARDGQDVKELEALQLLGEQLLKNAAALDPFYEKFQRGDITQEEIAKRFSGRGCFANYFNVV